MFEPREVSDDKLAEERLEDMIQRGISKSKTIAVFIGRSGPDLQQYKEVIYALTNKKDKIIPIMLPDSERLPRDFSSLEELNPIRFDRGVDDPAALDLLAERITGKRPPPEKEVLML